MLISSYRLIYTPLCYKRGFRVDVSKALYFIWNCKREINKNPCLLWGHKYNFHEDTNITTWSNKSFAQTWWKDKFPFSLMKFQLLRHSKLPEQKCYWVPTMCRTQHNAWHWNTHHTHHHLHQPICSTCKTHPLPVGKTKTGGVRRVLLKTGPQPYGFHLGDFGKAFSEPQFPHMETGDQLSSEVHRMIGTVKS